MRAAVEQFAQEAGVRSSGTSLGNWMSKQFGHRLEPWLVQDAEPETEIGIDFDGSGSGVVHMTAALAEGTGVPQSVELAASAPIARARTKASTDLEQLIPRGPDVERADTEATTMDSAPAMAAEPATAPPDVELAPPAPAPHVLAMPPPLPTPTPPPAPPRFQTAPGTNPGMAAAGFPRSPTQTAPSVSAFAGQLGVWPPPRPAKPQRAGLVVGVAAVIAVVGIVLLVRSPDKARAPEHAPSADPAMHTSPNPNPNPNPQATPTATPTPIPIATPTPTPTPTPMPQPNPIAKPIPTPTPTASPTKPIPTTSKPEPTVIKQATSPSVKPAPTKPTKSKPKTPAPDDSLFPPS
jgi:hypothetical protein